jgi:hypothetical protein
MLALDWTLTEDARSHKPRGKGKNTSCGNNAVENGLLKMVYDDRESSIEQTPLPQNRHH